MRDLLEKFGFDSLVYKDIPEPEPKAGHILIQIKAFGINHAEMHMRRGGRSCLAGLDGLDRIPDFNPLHAEATSNAFLSQRKEHVLGGPSTHSRT